MPKAKPKKAPSTVLTQVDSRQVDAGEADPIGWMIDAGLELAGLDNLFAPYPAKATTPAVPEEVTSDGTEGNETESPQAAASGAGQPIINVNLGDLFRKPKRGAVPAAPATAPAAKNETAGGGTSS
jgi:hypothetical protein